jgi:hypothetical protein
MAGHCRTKIWLAAQGVKPEPFADKTEMIFGAGDVYEALVLDGITIYNPETKRTETRGPWWGKEITEIGDPTTGEMIDAREVRIHNRQEEVVVDGVVGHLDGIARFNAEFVVMDVKSMSDWSYKQMFKKVLLEDVFSREYVFQQHFYMEGKRIQPGGVQPSRAALICINKSTCEAMLRFIPYDPRVVVEMKERLAWRASPQAPIPEWEWEAGRTIPLRCGYCEFRQGCAGLRGVNLIEKGAKWEVAP